MNYLCNPAFPCSLRGAGNPMYICVSRYGRFTNPMYTSLPISLLYLVTANLAGVPVLALSNTDNDGHQLALKVTDENLLVVKYNDHSEGGHIVCQPNIMARYSRVGDTTDAKLVDDFCRLLTTHMTGPIMSIPVQDSGTDLHVGFADMPVRDSSRNVMRIRFASETADDNLAASNISEYLFWDKQGRQTSVSATTLLYINIAVWRTAFVQNATLSEPSEYSSSDTESFFFDFEWNGPGVCSLKVYFDVSYSLSSQPSVTIGNNAAVRYAWCAAQMLDKVSAFVNTAQGGAGIDYDRIQSIITASNQQQTSAVADMVAQVQTTLGEISTLLTYSLTKLQDNTQGTLVLADIAVAQNKIGQALQLAQLRKTSTRKWFTDLVERLGDVTASTIDDADLESITQKVLDPGATSMSELQADPRGAYSDLFDNKGVNHG